MPQWHSHSELGRNRSGHAPRKCAGVAPFNAFGSNGRQLDLLTELRHSPLCEQVPSWADPGRAHDAGPSGQHAENGPSWYSAAFNSPADTPSHSSRPGSPQRYTDSHLGQPPRPPGQDAGHHRCMFDALCVLTRPDQRCQQLLCHGSACMLTAYQTLVPPAFVACPHAAAAVELASTCLHTGGLLQTMTSTSGLVHTQYPRSPHLDLDPDPAAHNHWTACRGADLRRRQCSAFPRPSRRRCRTRCAGAHKPDTVARAASPGRMHRSRLSLNKQRAGVGYCVTTAGLHACATCAWCKGRGCLLQPC